MVRYLANQKKIITGLKTGNPADPSLAATTGLRSKHNTYLSVPLIWAMINAHSAAGPFASDSGWIIFAVIILVGWMIVKQLYSRAGKIKGF